MIEIPNCPECGKEMEEFSYGEGCTTFWRCPWCLRFGQLCK